MPDPPHAPHPRLRRASLPEDARTGFQRRVRAGSALLTLGLAAALALHDWGPGTVLSPVRPAVKAALNRWYGVDGGGKA